MADSFVFISPVANPVVVNGSPNWVISRSVPSLLLPFYLTLPTTRTLLRILTRSLFFPRHMNVDTLAKNHTPAAIAASDSPREEMFELTRSCTRAQNPSLAGSIIVRNNLPSWGTSR